MVAQFTGVIASGIDDNGFFGSAGVDLTGDAVTATFTVDTSNGASTFDPPNMSGTFGGGSFGTTSPVSAVVEINGDSFILTGTYSGQAYQFAPPSGQSAIQYSVQDRNAVPGGHIDFVAADGAFSNSDNFVKSFDYRDPPLTVPASDLGNGTFEMLSFDDASGQITSSDVLSWRPSSVTISVSSSVPEPGAWVLMIAGLAGVGAVARLARSRTSAA